MAFLFLPLLFGDPPAPTDTDFTLFLARYKNGTVEGKVWGPWCGSSLHFLELMSKPRWEDWEITYTTPNRFQYLGNGKTEREERGGDLSYYLRQPGAT